MKLTETKLRQIIKDVLHEAIYSDKGVTVFDEYEGQQFVFELAEQIVDKLGDVRARKLFNDATTGDSKSEEKAIKFLNREVQLILGKTWDLEYDWFTLDMILDEMERIFEGTSGRFEEHV